MATGPYGVHQHGEQSQAVAGEHIGEDPIADQGHLLCRQLQLLQDLPQRFILSNATLIITPPNLFEQWLGEFKKFLKPEKFEQKARLMPRPALPPPRVMRKYMSDEKRGYLRDLAPGGRSRRCARGPVWVNSARAMSGAASSPCMIICVG